MPRRRRSADPDEQMLDSTENLTMTSAQLSSLLTTIQQTNADMCERLLKEVRSSTPVMPADHSMLCTTSSSNFSKCSARFSGCRSDDVEAFIDAVQVYKNCLQISDENAVMGFSLLLTKEAARWWQGIKKSTSTWEDAIVRLRSAFGARRPPFMIYKELFQMSQGNENTDIFISKVRALLAKLPDGDLCEKVELDITYSLLDRRIRKRLDRESVQNFDELLRKARAIEDSLTESKATGSKVTEEEPKKKIPPASQRDSSSNSCVPSAEGINKQKKLFCAYCKSHSHLKINCDKLANKNKPISEIKCYSCNAPNVTRSQCKNCNNKNVETFYSVSHVSDRIPTGRSGNVARDPCSPAFTRETRNPSAPLLTRGSAGASTFTREPAADKGNTANVAVDFYYDNNFCNLPINKNCNDTFSAYSNNDCVIQNDTFSAYGNNACVTPNDNCNDILNRRPILKISLLGKCGTALVDSAAKSCIAGHTLYALLRNEGHPLRPSTQIVKLADGVTREMDVLTTEVEVTLHNRTKVVPFLIFPESNANESLLGINFLSIFNLVFDFGNRKWHFADSLQKFDMTFEKVSPLTPCSSVDVLRDDEATSLTSEQREVLANLLVENGDIFEPGGAATPFAEHVIDTGDHPPIAVPPYRLTPAKKELMRTELDKMLADGIIEECESAWMSPALLVPKANGKVRFCVDYRKLNAVTKTDVYPMPLIDELVQSTKKNCFMTSLDMRSGFWQVSVREQDKDKTAFSTPFGSYRFNRMPFGLKNAPSTFQRLIDRLRTGASLKNVTLLAYQDDLLVISEGSFENHINDLRAVFERLRLFKLRANREKCVFARDEVKYLGHVITQDGISPDNDKVRAVLEMKPPSSLKHLRTFIQTCSWFRKFIPNFSAVAEPLTRLLKKNQPWNWSSDQARAFDELKKRLSSAPILVQADYNKPFVLRTDSSSYALGAVLLQGEGKDERPIEYASRLLIPAERNYSTTEREALAVVWAVERFRGYIDGHEVIIGSDHQPLKWLFTLKSPSGRLVRWALKLQAFNLQFQYTPGKANVVADTLSRPTCDEVDKDQCAICSVIVDLPARSPEDLRRAQLDDLELKKIISELEDTSDPQAIGVKRWSERGYFMQQGVLYRYNPDVDSEEPQLVVPASLRLDILKECHDTALAGHHGVDRTYHRIAQRFYFPGMRRFIADYVKSCATCQRYKASNEKPAGLLQTPVLNQRGEVLAIDLFGPLPKAESGEKWILLIEDTASRWVEIFALKEATAEVCAQTLIEEYFLRYGLPRRILSDNGSQLISAAMQQCMFILGIKQELIPLYHPSANPAERKNRDLKFQISRLVDTNHSSWPKHLPAVRFAMNTAVCKTTGVSPAYLSFARELRTPVEVHNDIRSVLNKDNFVPQITPYLKNFVNTYIAVRERVETQQDQRKEFADRSRKPGDIFEVGDKVLLKSHVLSNSAKKITSKFIPKRDGPYVVKERVSPTAYIISDLESPNDVLGKFHISELTRFFSRDSSPPRPVVPKRNRGRPRKHVCPVC